MKNDLMINKVKNKIVAVSPAAFDTIVHLKNEAEKNGTPKTACSVASELILKASGKI